LAISFRRIPPLLLVLCGLALPAGATATEAGVNSEGAAPPGESVKELDEVAVTGKKLRVLRREVFKAEDRFYERFNTLNTNDDFDIHCRMDKPTGTIVPQRECRIQFLAEAGAMDAREFLQGLTTAAAARGVHTPLAVLQPLWLQRREEYRQTAKALLEKNPELLALATEWGRLREQYDRERKERHKDRIILF
jgi:hypothetical protein